MKTTPIALLTAEAQLTPAMVVLASANLETTTRTVLDVQDHPGTI
jgi:hypothetical protein